MWKSLRSNVLQCPVLQSPIVIMNEADHANLQSPALRQGILTHKAKRSSYLEALKKLCVRSHFSVQRLARTLTLLGTARCFDHRRTLFLTWFLSLQDRREVKLLERVWWSNFVVPMLENRERCYSIDSYEFQLRVYTS